VGHGQPRNGRRQKKRRREKEEKFEYHEEPQHFQSWEERYIPPKNHFPSDIITEEVRNLKLEESCISIRKPKFQNGPSNFGFQLSDFKCRIRPI